MNRALDLAVAVALGLALAVGSSACARPETTPARPAHSDPLDEAASGVSRAGCDDEAAIARALGSAPLPSSPPSDAIFDVVVYTAHPDDEAMYAGGTMDRLVAAGRRVAFVTMSHGEGGRLLERAGGREDGPIVERRDYPRAHVVAVRDAETAEAARAIGVSFSHLHPAEANIDYAWTTSCSATLAHWHTSAPGGLRGILRRLVDDLRARRPRVVVTLDPRDDPQASHHGHHKATGVLADVAARLAADPAVPGGRAHVVEELLTVAPSGARADVTVPVRVEARLAMLRAYRSQFVPEKLGEDEVAQRPTEGFVVRWRTERGGHATRSALAVLAGVTEEPR